MVLESGRRLASRGHDVHCVCIRADDAIIGNVRGIITFHEIGGPLSSQIGFWLGFRRSCRRINELIRDISGEDSSRQTVLFPQVFPANLWVSYVAGRRPALATVWYCQEPSAFIHSRDWKRSLPWPKNWIALLLGPILAMVDRRFFLRFRHVLVNSKFSKRYTQRIYGYRDDQCRVVYLGVDHDRFRVRDGAQRRLKIVTIAIVASLRSHGMKLKWPMLYSIFCLRTRSPLARPRSPRLSELLIFNGTKLWISWSKSAPISQSCPLARPTTQTHEF